MKWFTDSGTFCRPSASGQVVGRNRSASGGLKIQDAQELAMIRKLKSGEYRLYSRKVDPRTGKRRNLGTFKSREAAEKHEREVQYFKRH
ncbi:hypothetical protein [Mesorhizobium sp. GbtcB19]|nr:hypothetical protein [Mesorhizobium sp. GbtcB19]